MNIFGKIKNYFNLPNKSAIEKEIREHYKDTDTPNGLVMCEGHYNTDYFKNITLPELFSDLATPGELNERGGPVDVFLNTNTSELARGFPEIFEQNPQNAYSIRVRITPEEQRSGKYKSTLDKLRKKLLKGCSKDWNK